MKSISKIKSLLFTSALLATTQTAHSTVIVNFHDDGTDVTVTFDGTLALNPAFANDNSTNPLTFARADGPNNTLLSLRDNYFQNARLGISGSAFTATNTNTRIASDIAGNFGFSGDSIYWGASEISGTSGGGVNELTVSAANNFFILRSASLASLNIDSMAQNTVLWTSYSSVTAAGTSGTPALPGDTITFTSSSVAAVPEPSSLLLCSLGGLGLLSARRRR